MSTPSYSEWLRRQMQIDDLAMQAHRSDLDARKALDDLYRANGLRTFRRWDSGEHSVVVFGESVTLMKHTEFDNRLWIHNLTPDALRAKDPTGGHFDAEIRRRAALALEAFLAWRDRGSELPESAPWEAA